MEEASAIVVGGGMAGLGAALRLRQAGIQVTLLEADSRLGGRARSERIEDFVVDTGGHLLFSSDVQLHALARDAKLGKGFLPLRPTALYQVYHGVLGSIDPTDLRGLSRIPGLSLLDTLRSLRLGRLGRRYARSLEPGRPEHAAVLDDRSLADFVRLYAGSSALERWIGPALSNITLCDEAETSRVPSLQFLGQRRFATSGTPRGMGISDLADVLGASLSLELGAAADAVSHAADRAPAVTLRAGGVEHNLQADAVVVATPARDAARLVGDGLSHPEREFLEGVQTLPALTLALGFEGRIAGRATRIRVPHTEGWGVEAISLEPGGDSERVPDAHELALVVATAEFSRSHLQTTDAEVEARLVPALERLFPVVRNRHRRRFTRIFRHPAAFPAFPVGAYRAIDRFQRIQRDRRAQGRRLYFAGDYLVAPWVEGALMSGSRAAEAVCQDLGAGSP